MVVKFGWQTPRRSAPRGGSMSGKFVNCKAQLFSVEIKIIGYMGTLGDLLCDKSGFNGVEGEEY